MSESQISAVDSAYIVACLGLVMLMTPGLALFYGGMVRQSAATDMMLQNFVALGVLTLLWYVCGFSMAFGSGIVWGNPMDYFMWNNLRKHEPWPLLTISQMLFASFQMMFAIITPILMTGTFADRMRFGPFMLFIVVWSMLVYFPWCHMIWGGGYFQVDGVWDFAGGIVVHTTAGWSALATALVLGPRKAVLDGTLSGEPHSIPVILIGTGLLWFGWFGFNGGSALAMSEVATTAVVNSHLAAGSCTFVWGLIDWLISGKPKLVPLCIACVAGLVIITPSCGYIEPHEAVLVGVIGAFICYTSIWVLKQKLKVDDALDVWGVHGMGGSCGTILIGLLADGPECLEDDAPEYCVFPHSVAATPQQMWLQTKAVLVAIVWSFVGTATLLAIMMRVMKVLPDEAQFQRLDEELHGEPCYQMNSPAKDAEG